MKRWWVVTIAGERVGPFLTKAGALAHTLTVLGEVPYSVLRQPIFTLKGRHRVRYHVGSSR